MLAAMVLGEHADHEPRRAVPALRSAHRRHRRLHGRKLAALGQRFHSNDFLSDRSGKRHETAIDRLISGSVDRVADQKNRASAAFTFGATFLCAGETLVSYEIEQREVSRLPVYFNGLSVQGE